MAQTKTKAAASKTKTAKKAAPKKPAAKATVKKATTKKATKPAASKAKAKPEIGEDEVKLDRRRAAERRDEEAAAEQLVPDADGPKLERREKVSRRRQIDPTTCERDYSDSEVEFMNALDVYKRTSGRMFPTCSEVLEVIRGIGYTQLNPAELAMIRESRGESAEGPSVEDAAETEAQTALAESEEFRLD